MALVGLIFRIFSIRPYLNLNQPTHPDKYLFLLEKKTY